MLSEEELMKVYRVAAATFINEPADHLAGLRAVEDAVRADQIEKDAAIAESQMHPDETPCGVCKAVAAIRAQPQLNEGTNDE